MKHISWVRQAVVAVAMLAATVGLAQGPNQAVSAAKSKGVVSVNYVKNYGPVFWKKSGKKLVAQKRTLKTGSKWKVFGVEKYGKDYLYDMGGGQRTNSRYMDMYGETSEQALNAVVQLNRDGTYKETEPNGRVLPHSYLKPFTRWRVSQRRVIAGEVWYCVGKNAWIPDLGVSIVRETARGVKKYPLGLTLRNPSAKVTQAEVNWRVRDELNDYRLRHGLKKLRGFNQQDLKQIQTVTVNSAKGEFSLKNGSTSSGYFYKHPLPYWSFISFENLPYSDSENAGSTISDKVLEYYKKEVVLKNNISEIGVGIAVNDNLSAFTLGVK